MVVLIFNELNCVEESIDTHFTADQVASSFEELLRPIVTFTWLTTEDHSAGLKGERTAQASKPA